MSFFLPVAASYNQSDFRQFLFEDILFDFSRQMISDSQLACLQVRANNLGLTEAIKGFNQGHLINKTENRKVLHPLLRASFRPSSMDFAEVDLLKEIELVQVRMEALCNSIHDKSYRTAQGEAINDIVILGVGGSDLGPRLVIEALYHLRHPNIRIHHVSNLDGADLKEVLTRIDPENTLFCISSKSFTTSETMSNFQTLTQWIKDKSNIDLHGFFQSQVIALTADPEKPVTWGVATSNIYRLWDWVGGRFSLWSAIGLPIALALGMPAFKELLRGAAMMDEHFFTTPLAQNIPVLMGLIGIWNIEQFDAVGLSIAPYSHRLRSLSKYLQQLEMESNGKRLKEDGTFVASHTAPIVFGDAGTNGQHAYFQMLHQGTRHIPTDFIAVVNDIDNLEHHHDQLLANCFAQSEALAEGKIDQEAPYKSCSGGQRSTTILLPDLTPFYLGALLAAYEHKVFVQGFMWGINSFDQWGVELGKNIAKDIYQAMLSPKQRHHLNPLTLSLIEHVERVKSKNNHSKF